VMTTNPFDDDAALKRVRGEPRAHAFAVVTVLAVATEKAGTRSATARYEVRIEEQLAERLPSGCALKHWGATVLLAQQRYLVGVVDSGRFHGAWELGYARDVTDLPTAQLRCELEVFAEP
jgi:hypothetical protein